MNGSPSHLALQSHTAVAEIDPTKLRQTLAQQGAIVI